MECLCANCRRDNLRIHRHLSVQDLVREGRITAGQGAWLLTLREELRLRRRPRWRRLLSFLWRVLTA